MDKWDNNKDTEALIKFIIKEELDLEDYSLLVPAIEDNSFLVYKKGGGMVDATVELVDAIIEWEKGKQISSLQKMITDNFIIYDNQ